jgi:hypothetical protein
MGKDSCSPNGTVGAVNPASGQSIDTQISAAKNAEFQLSPGQTYPAEGSQPSPASSSASTKSNSTKSQRISGGAIAGIVIGIILIVAALATATALLLPFFMRRFKRQTTEVTPELDSRPIGKIKDVEEQYVPIIMSYDQHQSFKMAL